MFEKYKTLIEIARSRGYTELMRQADYSTATLANEMGLSLHLEVEHSTFEITSLHKYYIKLTTGSCGSFEDESHFRKFEKRMLEYMNVLNTHDNYNHPDQENNPCRI